MLRTVQLVDGVPVLGVNVGLLGYLAEIEPPALTAALERWLNGEYTIEERMMLEITVECQRRDHRALNEAVIQKHESGHTVRLLASIAGERLHQDTPPTA